MNGCSSRYSQQAPPPQNKHLRPKRKTHRGEPWIDLSVRDEDQAFALSSSRLGDLPVHAAHLNQQKNPKREVHREKHQRARKVGLAQLGCPPGHWKKSWC